MVKDFEESNREIRPHYGPGTFTKKICKICDKEIISKPYMGKVYIIQEDPTMLQPFPTMYFHVNCYILKHYLKLEGE